MGYMDQGYWMDKDCNLIDVSTKLHIGMIIQYPDLFGTTRLEIENLYKEFNEKLGAEGNQREFLCRQQYKLGWVRIRKYKTYWSIQCDNYKKRKKSIDRFIENQVYGRVIVKKMDLINGDIIDSEIKKYIMSQFDQLRISSDVSSDNIDLFYNMEQKQFIEEIVYNKNQELLESGLYRLQRLKIYDLETYFDIIGLKEIEKQLSL